MKPLPPFPTSVGILLGVSLTSHLAAAVYYALGHGLTASIFFIIGQFALSVGLLRLYDGAWVFQDMRVPLVVFLFLYGVTLPLIALAKSEEMPGMATAAFLFGTALLGFNFVQWWQKQPWKDVSAEALAPVRATFANSVLVAFSFVAIVLYAYAQGTRQFLTLDRTQMHWLYTQTWIVANMLINGFMMYMFAAWPSVSKNARRLCIAAVAAFVILQLGLGNRHAFLPMFIFLAGVIASRRRATIGFRTILLAFTAFTLLMAIGVVRYIRSAPWAISSNLFLAVAEHNEFTMPIQTAMYYVNEHKPLKLGYTYLTSPSVFVPRALWPEKPISLSLQFNHDQFGDVISTGYAFTPVTEAYINFSVVGPFIILALVSLATVYLVRHARERPMLYFLCFSLVVDFNRGESLSVIYPLAVTGVAFWMMRLMSRIEWVPRGIRGGWLSPLEPERVSDAAR